MALICYKCLHVNVEGQMPKVKHKDVLFYGCAKCKCKSFMNGLFITVIPVW